MTRVRRLTALALVLTAHAIPALAQTITVRETAGIRRTQFPVTAHVPLAKGALSDPARARLTSGDTDTPAQFSAGPRWEDGSLRSLDVIFNVSVGPSERQSYRLVYGEQVTPSAPPRGMTVTEDADSVQAGNLKFNKKAGPLVASANYRAEFIGPGANGLSVVDAEGRRHAAGASGPRAVDTVARGPLAASIRYEYLIPVDSGYSANASIVVDAPSSKSWLKATIVVSDHDRELGVRDRCSLQNRAARFVLKQFGGVPHCEPSPVFRLDLAGSCWGRRN